MLAVSGEPRGRLHFSEHSAAGVAFGFFEGEVAKLEFARFHYLL